MNRLRSRRKMLILQKFGKSCGARLAHEFRTLAWPVALSAGLKRMAEWVTGTAGNIGADSGWKDSSCPGTSQTTNAGDRVESIPDRFSGFRPEFTHAISVRSASQTRHESAAFRTDALIHQLRDDSVKREPMICPCCRMKSEKGGIPSS